MSADPAADLFPAAPLPEPAQVLAHLDVQPPDAWEGTLGELLDLVTGTLERRGIGSARGHAAAVVIELGRAMGGRYLPKGDDVARAVRDAQIWRDYRGRPADVDALARRWKVSTIRIYQILAAQRALEKARGGPQGELAL